MAPEIVQRKDYCGPPVDVWAVGVLLFVLISGRFPFRGSTDKKLYHRISHQDIEFNEGVSLEVKLLISQMLCKEPELRPDIDKVLKESEWINNRKILDSPSINLRLNTTQA